MDRIDRTDRRGREPRPHRLSNGGLPPPAPAAPIEGVLRRALVERDERALDEAVRRMRPLMSRIALAHVRSLDDADDLIQETWVAALLGIARFQGRALLSTWLLRILTYRARTMGRKSARTVPLSHLGAEPAAESASGLEPLFGGRTANPDDALRLAELHEALAAALAALPPRQREVFDLRTLEGESAERVCERLGVTPANQRVLLHRARTQIRRRLDDYGPRARRVPAEDAESVGRGGARRHRAPARRAPVRGRRLPVIPLRRPSSRWS